MKMNLINEMKSKGRQKKVFNKLSYSSVSRVCVLFSFVTTEIVLTKHLTSYHIQHPNMKPIKAGLHLHPEISVCSVQHAQTPIQQWHLSSVFCTGSVSYICPLASCHPHFEQPENKDLKKREQKNKKTLGV
jgi:hypothetical protein